MQFHQWLVPHSCKFSQSLPCECHTSGLLRSFQDILTAALQFHWFDWDSFKEASTREYRERVSLAICSRNQDTTKRGKDYKLTRSKAHRQAQPQCSWSHKDQVTEHHTRSNHHRGVCYHIHTSGHENGVGRSRLGWTFPLSVPSLGRRNPGT